MSRRRDLIRGVAPVPTIRESSRLMHTHESMVDYMHRRRPPRSFIDVFAQGFFGLHFLRNLDEDPEDEIIYSDDDDDEYDYPYPRRNLEPHPRIRQLTDEEADKHARELIAEEERRKERTERNKRKKLRKKEKKRLEKENSVKEIITEEEKKETDSPENQEKNNPDTENENEVVSVESSESDKTSNETEAAGTAASIAEHKEENLLEINEKEEMDETEYSDLNNSYACLANLGPEEMCNPKPAKETKKEKTKLQEFQKPKEEKPKVVEKPEIQKKHNKKWEPIKEETLDPAAEELAKKSMELAANGNCLAASGQYEMAIKYFTAAIKYNPKEFKLFGNRSLCYERLQQYENALRDADSALCMEPNWIKGLFRKGKALCGLKRYYEASLIYKEVLKLESSRVDAMQELKQAQMLHLIEMGFSLEQSSEALKKHGTLEEAVEALFSGDSCPNQADASRDNIHQPTMQKEEGDEGEWTVLRTSRPRVQQLKEPEASGRIRSQSPSPSPPKSAVKPPLFSVWVGSLAPAVTYTTLHELFSRVGTVTSIKMLLEQQCAFVNYTKKEDCDQAIKCINGLVVEGAPLSVRYPSKYHFGLSSSYKKECFFWRTTGCTRQDCTFRHVLENKNIDRDKFTSRLGNFNL